MYYAVLKLVIFGGGVLNLALAMYSYNKYKTYKIDIYKVLIIYHILMAVSSIIELIFV